MPGKEREIVSRRLGPKDRIRVERFIIRARTEHGKPVVTVTEIPPRIGFDHDTEFDEDCHSAVE